MRRIKAGMIWTLASREWSASRVSQHPYKEAPYCPL